jgi:hypothetical protein
MRLDRTAKGHGKYAVINMRRLETIRAIPGVAAALETLDAFGAINYGGVGTEHEFFVLMLKDRFAYPALDGYVVAANFAGEKEYAQDIVDLRDRSGSRSQWCKTPD